MEGVSPSASPSRMGKRRIFQLQDSLSEPPRKSPAGAVGSPENVARFDFNLPNLAEMDDAKKEDHPPAASPSGLDDNEAEMSFKLTRPIKRAVRHRSPSPRTTLGRPQLVVASSADSAQAAAQDDGCFESSVSPLNSDATLVSGQVSRMSGQSFNKGTISSAQSSGSAAHPPLSSTPCRIPRKNSKDILDEYFANQSDRRRSSCKDITFQFLKRESSIDDPTYPIFSEVEVRRRLDTMEEEESPQTNSSAAFFGSSAPDSKKLTPFDKNAPPLLRSLSMDGYNSKDRRERRGDTQALLFDSTPDLVDDETYARFPSIRNQRRGAICYDTEPLLPLFQDLQLGEA